MKKKTPAKPLVFLILLLGGARAVPAPAPAAPPGRPNIVLILADDLGYGDVGAHGQTKIRTPRLDRMAREGTRFTQFYAGSPVCAPSRSALMTGQHTGHTWIRGNKEHPGGQEPLPDDVTTLADVLEQAGYATGPVGISIRGTYLLRPKCPGESADSSSGEVQALNGTDSTFSLQHRWHGASRTARPGKCRRTCELLPLA